MKIKFTKLFSADKKASVRRPIVQVEIFGPKGSQKIDALLDTGADRSLFDMSLGEVLGINFSKVSGEPFGGIGKGQVTVYTVKTSLQVLGVKNKIFIPIGFVKGANIPALLGQEGFFDAFKITFDRKDDIIDLVQK